MVTDRKFICPSCTEVLNGKDPGVVRMDGLLTGPGFSITLPFAHSSELGVYGAQLAPGLKLEQGCRVEFSCPHCHHSFTASYDRDLAEIEMVESDREMVVVFSQIYGEKSSFVFDFRSKKLLATYGEDASARSQELGRILNFFGS